MSSRRRSVPNLDQRDCLCANCRARGLKGGFVKEGSKRCQGTTEEPCPSNAYVNVSNV